MQMQVSLLAGHEIEALSLVLRCSFLRYCERKHQAAMRISFDLIVPRHTHPVVRFLESS
jgi:hypothetical protein